MQIKFKWNKDNRERKNRDKVILRMFWIMWHGCSGTLIDSYGAVEERK